jgi:hypothetical protein
MHFRLIAKSIVVSLALGFLLLGMPRSVHAVFSPVLNTDVVRIRQHIVAARQQNGTGTWLNAMEKVNQANAQAKTEGKATGTPGGFYLFDESLKELVVQSTTESFLDGISLLFGFSAGTKGPISTCLRDDIWAVQSLQEEALNELFKAALLNDDINSRQLWNDYLLLKDRLEGKINEDTKESIPGLQKDEGWKQDKYWFPDGGVNYYKDCPYGEFKEAIDELVRTVRHMADQTDATLGSFVTIPTVAEKRAKVKAAEYIAKNQIKLSLGGERGSNPMGLINGNGVAGLGAKIQTEFNAIMPVLDMMCASVKLTKDMADGLIIAPDDLAKVIGGTTCSNQVNYQDVSPDIKQAFQTYQAKNSKRENDMKRLKTALKFNVGLDNVSEEGLIEIERLLVNINSKIKEAPRPNAVPEMCRQIQEIMIRQCKNKTPPNLPDCDKNN